MAYHISYVMSNITFIPHIMSYITCHITYYMYCHITYYMLCNMSCISYIHVMTCHISHLLSYFMSYHFTYHMACDISHVMSYHMSCNISYVMYHIVHPPPSPIERSVHRHPPCRCGHCNCTICLSTLTANVDRAAFVFVIVLQQCSP